MPPWHWIALMQRERPDLYAEFEAEYQQAIGGPYGTRLERSLACMCKWAEFYRTLPVGVGR